MAWLRSRHYPLSTYLLFLQNWRFGLDGDFSWRFSRPYLVVAARRRRAFLFLVAAAHDAP